MSARRVEGERRGEVPFVAVRVGRSNDPREVLSLARELKISRAHALGFVVLWEEFLLEIGDALTGRVKGYSVEHLAAKLGWEGKPRLLVDALKRAGLLKTHKSVFFHAYWASSITGQYARQRAEDREYWRLKKRAQREKDVPGESPGHEGDVQGDSRETADIKKERKKDNPGSAPPAPPGTGGELGAARWEWMRSHYERCVKSRRCVEILQAMTEDNWALCQWVITESARGGALYLSRKKRALRLDSHRFLATEAFLQFLPESRRNLEAQQRRSNGGSPTVEPINPLDNTPAAIAFLLEQLSDPDLPAAQKTKIRHRWADRHPGETPPWEAPGGRSGAETAQA